MKNQVVGGESEKMKAKGTKKENLRKLSLARRIMLYAKIKIRISKDKPVGARFARSYLYATSMFSCFHA